MEKIALSIKKWIYANKTEFWLLLLILAVGTFLRLYKIEGYMTFLGDEGRDVIIVRRLLTEFHPPLIGPGTSIGQMYLGPFYYYFMAPGLLLAAFSPVGPAVQIAILGVITIWFIWYVARSWFNKNVALVAAGLYAISPTVIIYSRSSWNPNIMPFFALLSVYSVWKYWRDNRPFWLIILSLSFGAVLQSHYLGLLIAPTLFLFWAHRFIKNWTDNKLRKTHIKYSFIALALFVLFMSPLVFFDMRHGWINSKAIYTFFTVRQTTVSIKPWNAIPKIPETLTTINTSLVGGKNIAAGKIVTGIFIVCIAILFAYFVRQRSKFKLNPAYLLLLSWLGFGLVGFGLYKQNIYDHYYGFVFPVPYIVVGIITAWLSKINKVTKILALFFIAYLIFLNLHSSPLKDSPNYQLKRARDVAEKIKEESHGEPFNLGVIAERNYEDGYKYFLLKDNMPVVNIDSQSEGSIKNQLFAVCELPKEKCDPTHNSTAAIANFGWSKVDGQWEMDGVIIYRLIHTN